MRRARVMGSPMELAIPSKLAPPRISHRWVRLELNISATRCGWRSTPKMTWGRCTVEPGAALVRYPYKGASWLPLSYPKALSESTPLAPQVPSGNDERQAEADQHDRFGRAAAQRHRRPRAPGPPASPPQGPGRQQPEEGGEDLQVEVERAGPPDPRVDRQHNERTGHHEVSGALPGAPPRSHQFEDPEEGHQLDRHSGHVLEHQEDEPARVEELEERERVDEELEVVGQEGRAPVDGPGRGEVAGGHQVPRLVIEGEVRREREPAEEAGALEQEPRELDGEDRRGV